MFDVIVGIAALSYLIFGVISLTESRNIGNAFVWLLGMFVLLGMAKIIEIYLDSRKFKRESEILNARREGYEEAKRRFQRKPRQ